MARICYKEVLATSNSLAKNLYQSLSVCTAILLIRTYGTGVFRDTGFVRVAVHIGQKIPALRTNYGHWGAEGDCETV